MGNYETRKAVIATEYTSAPTVLVIDDDLNLLPFLVDMLSVMTPYRIITARNGVEGLVIYAEQHPQCVIVDMKMPELDGAQFVRALRGDPSTLNTPIIMMTAMGSPSDHFMGMAAGVDQYLVKPVEPEALVAAIEQALALSHTERLGRLRDLANSADDIDCPEGASAEHERASEGEGK